MRRGTLPGRKPPRLPWRPPSPDPPSRPLETPPLSPSIESLRSMGESSSTCTFMHLSSRGIPLPRPSLEARFHSAQARLEGALGSGSMNRACLDALVELSAELWDAAVTVDDGRTRRTLRLS